MGALEWMPPWAAVVKDQGCGEGDTWNGYLYVAHRPMQDGKACLLGMERVATWLVGRVARKMELRWVGGTTNYNQSGTDRAGDFCILFAPHKAKLTAHGIEPQNFGAGSRTDIMLPLRSTRAANSDYVLWVYVTTDYAVGTYDPQQDWLGQRNCYSRIRFVVLLPKSGKSTNKEFGNWVWQKVLQAARDVHKEYSCVGVHRP